MAILPEAVHIVGVGPGDPELLTLRAAKVLARAETILHAGPRDDAGFAFEVVASILRPGQSVRGMALAMRRGPDDGSVGYERVALALADQAKAGRRAAFLTEGDPMLFGTGSYVVEHLARLAPELSVEVVPGISALGAAAAKLCWPIAQKEEILTVCPATYHGAELGTILARGPVCFLKAADMLPALVQELERLGRLDRAALVERVGRADERIVRDLRAAIGTDLSYFSLVLVR
jgi:precorrin-2/cobalt-factor-2 C20-methyltransferase